MPFSQTDEFETDFGNWSGTVGGDDFNWQRNNTTTPSTGTGPGGGFSSTWYVYTETSSPVTNGQEALLLSNTINASLYDLTVSFRVHMVGMGDGSGYLAMECWDGSAWNEEWRQTGPNGATEDGTDYVLESINVGGGAGDSSHVYVNTDFQVRFRLHVSNAGNSYQNDAALDVITIAGPDAVTREQDSFRFRNDDGSESGASWKATQNTDVTGESTSGNKRLRAGMQAEGDPPSEAATVQYKEQSDAATEWRDI